MILNPALYFADQSGIRLGAIGILIFILLHSTVFGFVVALGFRAFVKPPLPGNLCPYCEYDLVGHESGEIICPECGKKAIKNMGKSA